MASQKLGSYAFLIAVIIAVVAGIVATFMSSMMNSPGIAAGVLLVLAVLGLVVGFLNIHDKHISDFLIATIAVAMVGGTAGGLKILDQLLPASMPIGSLVANVVIYIVAIAAGAALVVGLKQIMALAKEQVQ